MSKRTLGKRNNAFQNRPAVPWGAGAGVGVLLSKDDTAVSLTFPVLVMTACTGDMLEGQDAVKSYGHTASR